MFSFFPFLSFLKNQEKALSTIVELKNRTKKNKHKLSQRGERGDWSKFVFVCFRTPPSLPPANPLNLCLSLSLSLSQSINLSPSRS